MNDISMKNAPAMAVLMKTARGMLRLGFFRLRAQCRRALEADKGEDAQHHAALQAVQRHAFERKLTAQVQAGVRDHRDAQDQDQADGDAFQHQHHLRGQPHVPVGDEPDQADDEREHQQRGNRQMEVLQQSLRIRHGVRGDGDAGRQVGQDQRPSGDEARRSGRGSSSHRNTVRRASTSCWRTA